MPQPTYALSPDVRTLTDRFLSTPVGETITFDDMSRVIEAEIDARRYLIQIALRRASTEAGALFASVRKVGYVRLPAEEAAQVGRHARKRIRRATRQATTTMLRAVEKANDVSPSAMAQVLREVSALGLLQHLSRDRVVNALNTETKAEGQPLTVAATLKGMAAQLGITD